MKHVFNLHNVICSAFIISVIYILALLPAQFEVLDPVGKALEDFQLSDIVFTELRENPPARDDIVLVNIKHFDRGTIGKQIEAINEHNPAIVGIDAFFKEKKDFEKDFRLMLSLGATDSLVMVTKLLKPDKEGECFDSLQTSHPQFIENAQSGFANFITSPGVFKTTREFAPHFCLQDTTDLSFTSKIAQMYDSDAFDYLMARGNKEETINWRGNYKKFYSIEGEDVFDEDFDLSFIEGKIVLLGFLGEREIGEPSLEDTFFTPLNEVTGGRSVPDMFGVTVHANILSQILDKDYINTLPEWLSLLVAVILLYLNVSFFIWVGNNYKIYYDLITKSIQIVEVIILFGINLMALAVFQFKADFTVAIVAVLFCGDLTELYVGSLIDIGKNIKKRFF